MTWYTCTRQLCDDVEIKWCWTCAKITCFYVKHEGNLSVKIIGEKRFSHDLNQGLVELPATYILRSTDTDMRSKLVILVGEVMEVYNKTNKKAKSELNAKQKKKKRHFKKIGLALIKYFLKEKYFIKRFF